MDLASIAEAMLKDATYLEDARRFGRIGNSVAGSVLALTYKVPRWAAEQAVCEAVAAIDAAKRKKRKGGAA